MCFEEIGCGAGADVAERNFIFRDLKLCIWCWDC
jgi:hypothetical protein